MIKIFNKNLGWTLLILIVVLLLINTYNFNQPVGKIVTNPFPNQTGNLSIISNPSFANIYLDNVFRGVTPRTLNNLNQGIHSIKLTRSGYNDYIRSIPIAGGRTVYLYANLTPINQVGSLYITSTPSSASIYVDSLYKGLTPKLITNLTVGYHNLRLTKLYYRDYSTLVNISINTTKYLNVNLTYLGNQTNNTLYYRY